MLAGMTNPVRLAFFTQALNCETCEPTGQILRELAALTDKITVEEHNFLLEQDSAAYGMDRVPAIVPLGLQDYGIRFSGSRPATSSCRCSTRFCWCRAANPA